MSIWTVGCKVGQLARGYEEWQDDENHKLGQFLFCRTLKLWALVHSLLHIVDRLIEEPAKKISQQLPFTHIYINDTKGRTSKRERA